MEILSHPPPTESLASESDAPSVDKSQRDPARFCRFRPAISHE